MSVVATKLVIRPDFTQYIHVEVRCDRCGESASIGMDRHKRGRVPRGWTRSDMSPADGWPERSIHCCRMCSDAGWVPIAP